MTLRKPGPALEGALLGLGAAAIRGGHAAMSRAGVAAGLAAVDVAFLRFATAGLLLPPWILRDRPASLGGLGWGRAAALAPLAGPPFILRGVGGRGFAPLAQGAVLEPSAVVLGTSLLAALVLGERPGAARLLDLAVIVGGLAPTAGPGLLAGDRTTPVGDLVLPVAGVLCAGYTVPARRGARAPAASPARPDQPDRTGGVEDRVAVSRGRGRRGAPPPGPARRRPRGA